MNFKIIFILSLFITFLSASPDTDTIPLECNICTDGLEPSPEFYPHGTKMKVDLDASKPASSWIGCTYYDVVDKFSSNVGGYDYWWVDVYNYGNSASCVAPACPPGQEKLEGSEECSCISPTVPSYDLNGFFTCVNPSCPSYYENHNPPLPLFNVTDSPSKCNFFNFSDGAYIQIGTSVCCYGQESEDNNDTCALNEMEINGICYPITNDENNSDSQSHECPFEEYWSFETNSCQKFYPDNNDTNGTNPNTGGTGGVDTNNDGTIDNDELGLASLSDKQGYADGLVQDALGMDKIKDQLVVLLDGYVLLPLPTSIGGSCSTEFKKTINILGNNYILDVSEQMQTVFDLLPTLKMIILFMAAVSGIVIVLSSGKGD